MPDVIVMRGLGDQPGDDIIDPLISETHVALARGRAELDSQATAKEDVRYKTVYRSGLLLGQLAQVSDSLQGLMYRGKVTGIRHEISPTGAVTQLVIEREANF